MGFSSKKITLLSVPLVIFSLVAYYVVYLFSYQLTITKKVGGVELHTLQLGEYFSPVEELRISDEQNNSVVLFKANTEHPVMHTVTITTGVNEFNDMYLENYDIIYANEKPYIFLKGKSYKVLVKWSSSTERDSFTIK